MPTFSSALKTQLDAASTKRDWANTLTTALGTSRRLRCFRDADPNATDPAATGIEFLNVGSSGAIAISAGNITGFGVLSGVTKKLAADLSSGAAVLRLEGNGHWVQGTLGLTGSPTDFTFTANPTTSAGVAMSSGAGVRAPIMLDSGTGPLSPSATANTPYSTTIYDWSSGSGVAAGTMVFDTRLPNMVFDDPEMQASMGDVRVYRSSQKVTLGNMEFGALLFGIHKGANGVDLTEPVYEVLILRKPTSSNWPGYPRYTGYDAASTDTFGDKPFKATINRQDGTVLYTHQMHDGLPINDRSLNQDFGQISSKPLRPFFHCAGALPWRSHRQKPHNYAAKYYPGMADLRPLRVSCAHDNAAANPASMMVPGGQQNGMLNWYGMPKWSMAINATTLAADWPTQDAYLGEFNGASASMRYFGWGWEPGAFGGHDQLCGAGGVRFDRAVMPTVYAIYMTNPNWVRPRNNDPIIDLKEAWDFNYYNLPNFFVDDVTTGATVPVDQVMSNQWSHCLAFYGGNPSYTSGGTDYAIPVFAGGNKDKNGLFPWCGTSVDSLHNYWSPAWQAIFNNSAMAVYAQKHRLISSIMCQLGDVPDTKDPSGWFLCRNHAWRWMHYVMSWKLGTDHEFGVSRGMLEQRLENELNAIYSYIVKPTLIENSTSTFHTCLRNMGNPTYIGIPTQSSTSMTFYMTHVLQLMKTFGLWDVMYNKSVTCKAALDFVIRCLDLMAIDYVLDTTGYLYTDSNYDTLAKPDGSIAASWADWRANLRPQQAQEDWIHGLDGKPSGPFYSTELLRYQYVCLRRDWITDAMVPCARANGIALAIAKYESYMAVKDAAVGAAPGNFDKMAADFATYYPMYSPIKLPAA